jgi:hypothetical protein
VYYSDGAAGRDLSDAKSSCEVINEGKFTAVAAAKKPDAVPTPSPKAAAATKPGKKK